VATAGLTADDSGALAVVELDEAAGTERAAALFDGDAGSRVSHARNTANESNVD
jgi:hypothetical protein